MNETSASARSCVPLTKVGTENDSRSSTITLTQPKHIPSTGPTLQHNQLSEPLTNKINQPTHRIIRDEDVDWMADLARRRYPGNYDIESAELWMRGIVLKQPTVFYPIRTDHAFLVAIINVLPWTPTDFEANIVMLCAENGKLWEAIRLVRASIEWARKRNCAKWQINSDTKYNLGPIARHFGANEISPRYMIRLRP